MATAFHRNSNMRRRAQLLRKHATREEKRLWYEYLRTYPITFRRQLVIQNYIVDFCCPAPKLVIELDGSQHLEPEIAAYDGERTAILQSLGYLVLRYRNDIVNHSFAQLCNQIDTIVQFRLPPSSK